MPLPPDAKAQLEAQKQQCPFCKIVRKEIPGKIVFEDAKTFALLDIYPALKGHLLFMPKEHYPLLPYLSPEEFAHLFGVLPQLIAALQSAMITPAVQIFIANGGAAGQQSYHFLMHLLPREAGDGFFHFLFKQKTLKESPELQKLASTLYARMNAYFSQRKTSWHKGVGTVPLFLEQVKLGGMLLYEDEKVLCLSPRQGHISGQVEIYSKIEDKEIAKLSGEDSAHLFLVASFAASAAFESLGAQGTNIILKSGRTDDHPSGKLCIYILPRKQNDGLDGLLWQPKQPSYDLDSITEKIKDKTWKIKFPELEKKSLPPSPQEEIRKALELAKK